MLFLASTFAGLCGAGLLGFALTWYAAGVFTRVGGSRDGGPAMAAYFTIGPFGLLSGFLFGFASVLWLAGDGQFPLIVKSCCIAGVVVLAFAALIVFMTVRKHSQ